MILLHISHGVLWQLYILVVAWPPDHPFVCRISYVLPVGMKYFFFGRRHEVFVSIQKVDSIIRSISQ